MNLISRTMLLLLILISASVGIAQSTATLSGYVRDASSGEELINATILVPALQKGTYSNEYGFYALDLPVGEHEVIVRFPSYQQITLLAFLSKDSSLNFELAPFTSETVEITGEREDANVKDVQMSTAKISIAQLKVQPVLMGEYDVIRAIQLLPGVSAVGEGITGYFVRGGGADQNLILLDEATVYNASHLLGFFSVFNADALKDDVTLYKGGIPARYGGRLSSVLDLRMKEGNDKEFHATGGSGLISSRLSVQGPLVKERGSFLFSGRRTYADLFLLLSNDPQIRNNQLFFYDFNAKANYRFSDKDRIFLSGYFGKDKFNFQDRFANDWGNQTATLRWNHLFNDKLFLNTTLIYSDFDYGFDLDRGDGDNFRYQSSIADLSLKLDFTHFASNNLRLRYGGQITRHLFTPGRFVPADSASFYTQVDIPDQRSLEGGLYISGEHDVSDRLLINYGLRYSYFANVGPYKTYTFGEDRITPVDSVVRDAGEIFNSYQGWEPRLSVRWLAGTHSSIKASYNRTYQYLHLATNSTAAFPWDIWVPSSARVKPEIADQVALGWFQNFADNTYEFSAEVYYKTLQNQFDFRDGAILFLNEDIEGEFRFGEGEAYGLETMIQKKKGRLTGQLSYTLSRATRTIDGVNDGNTYSANSDRRHDISVVASWQASKRAVLSANFVYYTGVPITLPAGQYMISGQTINFVSERNGYRLPDYHRMDLSYTIDSKPKEGRRWNGSWNFSLYNAYGRKNAFAVLAGSNTDPERTNELVKVYLFRWVPSVTYNFEF
ncbi:MAG: TonB-dependent receptor [Bacteroidia bacterium]